MKRVNRLMRSYKLLTLIVTLSAFMSTGLVFSEQVMAQDTATPTVVETKVLLLDVRTEAEFKEDGLPSAINVPYQDISKKIKALTGGNKNKAIKLYSRVGRRSSIALKTLEQLGYTNVVNLGTVADAKNYLTHHPIN